MGISDEKFKNLLQIFWGWKLKLKKITLIKIGLKNVNLIEKMCTATMMEFCHTIKIWVKKGVSLGMNFAYAFGVAVGCHSGGWPAMT